MATAEQHLLPPSAFLDTHRQDDLDALFDSLAARTVDELQGVYQGRLIGITGLNSVPAIAKRVVYGLLGSWINPWRGKQFGSSSGANRWGLGSLTLDWGAYQKTDAAESSVISLDYNVPANPRIMRPILGEVRLFRDGLWLARMRYRTRNGLKTLLYFTLREIDQ